MEGAEIGLHVNDSKCELITGDDDVIQQSQSVTPDVIVVDPNTADLLCAPVGTEQSVDCVLEKKLSELMRLGDRLLH